MTAAHPASASGRGANTSSRSASLSSESFKSYAELVKRILPGTTELAFLGPDGTVMWSSSATFAGDERLLHRLRTYPRITREAQIIDPVRLLLTVPIASDDTPLGAMLLPARSADGESTDAAVARISGALRPVAQCLARELAQTSPPRTRTAVLTERTEELEWLFMLTTRLHSSSTETAALEQLLGAAVERMAASFGAIAIPDKRLDVTYSSRERPDAGATLAYQQTHPYLMSYIQRREAPLMANKTRSSNAAVSGCKILAVPIALQTGKPAGFIAFFKPASLPDFGRRQLYLGRHIAREIAAVVDSQYDLATGLLTRTALEQEVTRVVAAHDPDERHTVVYIDIDALHVINETFGFDIGDEVIVRIADLLHTPLLPASALVSRIAGDRFVVFLPACDAVQGLERTHGLQKEVGNITAGPDRQRIMVSVSCGVARLPQIEAPFARALAAAELACRTAKERGHNRSEVYLDVDDSMIRNRKDILSVMRLRAALEKNRLKLFAQRMAPLFDTSSTSGFECLVRLVAEDGEIIPPADFMSAAQRYQLQGQIDDWVIQHVLQAVKPYASMLIHSSIGVSIDVSGQSLEDDEFPRKLVALVEKSNVNPRLITFEIAETAAITHIASTRELIRHVRKLGCRIGLDDFGTGANSISYLRTLRPDRVKIDGSFINDVLSNRSSAEMVRTVAQFAAAHDIECVAEHVDSAGIAARLTELGVHNAQGNFIHVPEPLNDLLRSTSTEESQRMRRLYLEL
jgi:diguanylate cyclase (GGDEF)-like protein